MIAMNMIQEVTALIEKQRRVDIHSLAQKFHFSEIQALQHLHIIPPTVPPTVPSDDTPTHLVLNLTTGQYTRYTSAKRLDAKLRSLLKKQDDGESHWRRSDKIVCVPPHIEAYVIQTYNEVYV